VKSKSTKRYTIGEELFKIAKRVLQGGELSSIARPFLEKLVEDVDETVFLCVREDSVVKVIDTIRTGRSSRYPPRRNAAADHGIGVLQGLSRPHGGRRYPRLSQGEGPAQDTPNSITDLDRFIDEIRVTRKRHYSLDLEEYLMASGR
jgi:DNA-binding IclR family transcriptional regulator